MHLWSTYIKGFEMPPWSNTWQHEQVRRSNGTSRDYYLLPRTHLRQRVVAEKLDAVRASISYQNLWQNTQKDMATLLLVFNLQPESCCLTGFICSIFLDQLRAAFFAVACEVTAVSPGTDSCILTFSNFNAVVCGVTAASHENHALCLPSETLNGSQQMLLCHLQLHAVNYGCFVTTP